MMKLWRAPTKYKEHLRITFIGYALVLIVLLFLIFSSFILVSNKYSVTRVNQQSNNQIMAALKEQSENYFAGITELAANHIIEQALVEGGDVVAANRLILEFINSQKLRSYFSLFDQDGNLISTNFYQENQKIMLRSFTIWDTLKVLAKDHHAVEGFISDFNFVNGQDTVYHIGKAITSNGSISGYLIFDLREEQIREYLRPYPLDIIIITDHFDNIIFSTMPSMGIALEKYKVNKFRPEWTSKNNILIGNKPFYTTWTTFKGLNVITLTMTALQRQTILYGFVFLTISGFLFILLVFFLANKVTERNIHSLHELLKAIHECKNGNIDYRIQTTAFDEFQTIYDEFNNMMIQLQTSINNTNELAERKRIMEIKQLEAQFNPHFVFNIMETLKCMIALDPKEASKLVTSFASLMRYYINHGLVQVSLQTEMEYVETYLSLQKVRYNKRLDYLIDIDNALLDYKVPKLLLQPIVENCIVHNAEIVDRILVRVIGRKEGNILKIEISDNGKGILKEELDKLRMILESEDATPERIGIYNVHRTLQLMYGESFGLELESVWTKGTKVVLKIPIQEVI